MPKRKLVPLNLKIIDSAPDEEPWDEETFKANMRYRRRAAPKVNAKPETRGRKKGEVTVVCLCGARHVKNSPAHREHTKFFPGLCRKRENRLVKAMIELAEQTLSNGDVLTVYWMQNQIRICLRKSRTEQERIIIPEVDLSEFSITLQKAYACAPNIGGTLRD